MSHPFVRELNAIQQTYKPFKITFKNGHELVCQKMLGYETGNQLYVSVSFNGLEDKIDCDLILKIEEL